MRAIRAIAFDLEGPLLDFEQFHFEAHCRAMKQVLNETVTYEWLVENVPNAVGGGDPHIAECVARHYRRPHLIGELLGAKKDIFKGLLHNIPEIEARPGSVEAFRWFIKHGYRVAIGSNTPRESAMRYLHAIGIADLVPVVLAEDVHMPKPYPDVYIETARRLGVDPSTQLVIDDSNTGLEAAFRAGSPSIATPLHRIASVMEKVEQWVPRRIVHDWREVNLHVMMDALNRELGTQAP